MSESPPKRRETSQLARDSSRARLSGYASMDIQVFDKALLDPIRELGILIYRRPGALSEGQSL